MRFFILFNLVILILSIALTTFAFINYQVFLSSPLAFKILILLGLVTPLSNIYDVLKNFVLLDTLISGKKEE